MTIHVNPKERYQNQFNICACNTVTQWGGGAIGPQHIKMIIFLEPIKQLTSNPKLQKDFFQPVSLFSAKKCPKYVFSEFCHNMTHDIEQMRVFF